MFDVQKWWRNPTTQQGGALDVKICSPLFYVDIPGVSELVVETIKKHTSSPARIIELGCNCGRNLNALHKAGYDVSGVEISQNAKDIGFDEIKDTIQVISIEDYYKTETIKDHDVVLCCNVLMHLPPSSEWVFAEIVRHGSILVVLENENFIGHRYKWPRNYKDVFEKLGAQLLEEKPCGLASLPESVMLRVFKCE